MNMQALGPNPSGKCSDIGIKSSTAQTTIFGCQQGELRPDGALILG